MSSIDDVLTLTDTLKTSITEAITCNHAALGQADELYLRFEAAGAEGLANIINAAKEQLEQVTNLLERAHDEADAAASTTETARG